MRLTKAERTEVIDGALAAKFGVWWTWEKPILDHSIGPCNSNAFDEFEDRLSALRQRARLELEALGDNELQELQELSSASKRLVEWFRGLVQSEINQLKLQEPVWLMAGFGHPTARANFQHWSQVARYSLHEALMLSVGVEPELLPEHLVETPRKGQSKQTNPQINFLQQRRTVLKGHFPRDTWDGKSLSVSPGWLKDLIDRIELDVHPEFLAQLSRRVARDRGEAIEKPRRLLGSELESLLKLVAGMAIEQYGYNPQSSRNDAVRNIADDLDQLGIGLDLKTIRKWLKEACAMVDPENPPK